MSKSNIFLLYLLLFILGIGLASFVPVPFFIFYFLIVLIIFILFWFLENRKIKILIFGLFILLIGIFRYEISIPKMNNRQIAFYNGQNITFQAKIIKEPLVKNKNIQLIVEAKKLEDTDIKGRALVMVSPYSNYKYGDVLKITGKLNSPERFGNFDYPGYLARYNIYSICYYPKIKLLSQNKGNFFYGKILEIKSKAKDIIDKNFTEPQGTVISAMLLGLKNTIPSDLRNQFSQAGVSHILAVSGLHISVLSMFLSAFFISFLSIRRQKAFYLTFIVVCLFVVLTGASASAVRAAIMGIVLAYAEKSGRQGNSLRILILAGALMLFINPKLLKADIGFQLSFMACLGIALFREYFNNFFRAIPNFSSFPVREYLSITLSAQVFVFPLILYRFGNLSFITPLTNIFVLPILPWVMIFGFIFILGGLILPISAKILVWPVWLGLTYIINVVKIFSHIPYLSLVFGQVHPIIVLVLYLLILFFLIKVYQKKKLNY